MKKKIDPDYDPGHRITPEKIKHLFPDVEPRAALRDFIAHALDTGRVSEDWDMAFTRWCAGRQHKADEHKRDAKQTDSMGLPLDPAKRATMHVTTEGDYGTRFLHRLNEHLKQPGITWDEAYSLTLADEGDDQ